jgi:hypothetical protein
MAAVEGSDRAAVDRARLVLAESEAINLGAASAGDLCKEIGRLQVTVARLLTVIDSLTGR